MPGRPLSGRASHRNGRRIRALVLVAALLALPGVSAVAAARPVQVEADAEPLLVLAAASLADVMPRVAAAWEARGHPPVRFSFDATSRLAPQALRGAPADVFLSADPAWVRWLHTRGALAGGARLLLRNTLVVITPAASGPGPGSLLELATDSGPVAFAGENVPAGRYAREALERAGAWRAVEDRVVRGGSVRGVLEWVARGEVPAGVVYVTDAATEPDVRIAFRLPEEEAPAVRYAGAVLETASRPAVARAFLDFLGSPVARALFVESGFEPADGEPVDLSGPPAPDPVSAAPDPWEAIRLSLLVGLLTAVLGLIPAVGAGWVLARRQFTGKALVSTLVMAPLVMPPVVTGFLLLWLLGRDGPLGGPLAAVGLPVPFTPVAPVLAALVVGFPLYAVAVRAAFEAVDHRLEEVSWTLGVPPKRTFLRISLPLAVPGIAAGAVLAFARALGEFGATVVLAGNVEGRTRTIALGVYTLLESPGGEGRMWLLVGASVALSLGALLGYEALSRRQRRRLEDRRGG